MTLEDTKTQKNTFIREFPNISLLSSLMGKFILLVLWFALPIVAQLQELEKQHTHTHKKNAVRGAVAMYPTAGEGHYKIDLTTRQSEKDFSEFLRNPFPY